MPRLRRKGMAGPCRRRRKKPSILIMHSRKATVAERKAASAALDEFAFSNCLNDACQKERHGKSLEEWQQVIHAERKTPAPPSPVTARPVATVVLSSRSAIEKSFELRRERRERRHMSMEDQRSKQTPEDQSHGKRELEPGPPQDAKKQRRS